MRTDDLGLLIQARNPIISVETPDEPRAVRIVRDFAEKLKLPFYEWSIIDGLRQTAPPTGAKPVVEAQPKENNAPAPEINLTPPPGDAPGQK